MGEIMKPGHLRWHEFRILLQGKEGCNFSEDKPLMTKILNTMPEIDVPSSLKYFEDHGGHCDFDIALMRIA